MRCGSRLCFVISFLIIPLTAQQNVRLPETPAGQKAAAYFKAFNSGDTTIMRNFFIQHFAKDVLQRTPLEQRIERYRQLFSMTKGLAPRKVMLSREDHIRISVAAKDGHLLTMEFTLESALPYGIAGIGIDDAADEEETVPHAKNNAEFISQAESYVQKLAAADDFSGVVMIAKDGKPIFQKAWGYAEKEKQVLNTVNTKFNIGSMNKSFTTLAIHQLADQGKIEFSDPLKKFLPDYSNKEAAEKVTVEHLLSMTSGIGDFFGDRFITASKEKIKTIGDYLPLFADKPLEFEPGTQFRYSNGGFIVLGAIIEKVSGMDFYQYIAKNIYIPAGMTNSDWFERDALPENCAVGYTRFTGRGIPDSVRHRNTAMLPQRGSSAGGGYSTALDLLRYTIALQEGKIVPETFEGRGGLGIAGGTAGVNTILEWNPRKGYAVVVLSNYDPPIAEKVGKQLRMMMPE